MVLYMSIDDHDFEYELSKGEIADFLVDQMLKESGVDNTHSTRKVVRYMIDTLDLVYDEDFLSNYTEEIKENFAVLGITITALILAAMLCSSLLSRATKSNTAVRRTIVIEVGMQNAAQAIAIATSPFIFNSGEMAIPAIIYALLMNVILLVYVAVNK